MRRVIRLVDGLALLFVAWAALAMVPVEWVWFNPGNPVVSDSTTKIAPSVDFSRVIKRPTVMSYGIVIRNVSQATVVCDPDGGPFTYRPEATLPEGVDLVWWTGGDDRCWPRDVGTYIMETCWTVKHPFYGIVPPKTVCRESNTFTIFPSD